jgi:hypothetical protein
MEVFNDAMAAANSMSPPSDERSQPQLLLTNPVEVEARVLPALRIKMSMIGRMRHEHEQMEVPTSRGAPEVHRLLGEMIDVVEERGKLQHTTILLWLADQALVPDMTALDEREIEVVTDAMLALNQLIENVGLAGGPFIEINRQVMNALRHEFELEPIPVADFKETYSEGIAGRRARFFDGVAEAAAEPPDGDQATGESWQIAIEALARAASHLAEARVELTYLLDDEGGDVRGLERDLLEAFRGLLDDLSTEIDEALGSRDPVDLSAVRTKTRVAQDFATKIVTNSVVWTTATAVLNAATAVLR